MQYLIWELEIAPDTGTPHVQGYVRMNNRQRLTQMKTHICQTAHLEIARGSEQENKDYCSKERNGDDWGEFGEFDQLQRPGRRTDLEDITQQIIQGAPLREIALKYPSQWVRYHQGLQSLHRMSLPEATTCRAISTTILWGVSGVGKTHRVRTTFPNGYVAIPGRDPWASYLNQEVLIFDEFNPDLWPIQMMNHYLDKWPLQLDSRYYNKVAHWTKVFIISNINPKDWYALQLPELRQAFFRRISYTIEIKDRNQELLLI